MPPFAFSAVDEVPDVVAATADTGLATAFDPVSIREVPAIAALNFRIGEVDPS